MPRGQSIRGRAGARHGRSWNRCTRIANASPRRSGPVTNQARVFLIVALFALAFVALATGITLLIARRRAKLRAPLAGALTFSLVCIAGAAAGGAVALLAESPDMAVVAGVVACIAALSIGRVGLLRREHAALVGGNAAVAEARAAARATLRALVAATRLAERLDGASTLDEIDALLSDAARRALPDAVVAIVPAEPPHEGPHVDVPLRSGDERALRATWPAPPAHGRDDLSAAEVVLRALASEAALGVARLDGRRAAEAEVRRRDVTAALGERLRGADDAFGACHLAAQATGTELGARSAAIETAGINATFTLDGDRSGEHELVVPLDADGTLTLSLPSEPGPSDQAVASGIGDALARAPHDPRGAAGRRGARRPAGGSRGRRAQRPRPARRHAPRRRRRRARRARGRRDRHLHARAQRPGRPRGGRYRPPRRVRRGRCPGDRDGAQRGRRRRAVPGGLARRARLRRRRAAARRRRARCHLGAVPRQAPAHRPRCRGPRRLRADRRARHRPRHAGARARPARGAPRRLPRDHRHARGHPRAGRDLHGGRLRGPARPARRRRRRRDGVRRHGPARDRVGTDHAGAGRRVRPGRRAAAAGRARGPDRALRRRLVRPARVRCRAPAAARRGPALRALRAGRAARPASPPCSAWCGPRRMPRATTTSIWPGTSAPPPPPPSSAPRRWPPSAGRGPARRSCSASAG